jgi:hypothetical protein
MRARGRPIGAEAMKTDVEQLKRELSQVRGLKRELAQLRNELRGERLD